MAIKRPGSDSHIVYRLLKKEIPDFKFKLEEDDIDPELDTIWAESDELRTYMNIEDKALWINDDCQKHLDFDDCHGGCDPGCFVIKLAESEFIEKVDSILHGMETRRVAVRTIKEDPFAIVDRDARISQLEQLLKKNKIRIPKK